MFLRKEIICDMIIRKAEMGHPRGPDDIVQTIVPD